MTLKDFLKGLVYFSLALVPVLAWYVSESSFFPYITGKGFAFRTLIEVTFIAWIILAISDSHYRPKRSLVFVSYTAFLVIICIANLLGVDPHLSFFGNYERMEGWFTHLHLFLYFTILYSVYKTDQDWLKMIGWFMVSAFILITEGLFQLFSQKDFIGTKHFATSTLEFLNTAYPTHMGGSLRLDATLGNSEYYAIYTLLFFFISLLLAFKVNKWKGKQNYLSMFSIFFFTSVVMSQIAMILVANGLADTKLETARTIATLSSGVWFIGIIGLIFSARGFVSKMANSQIGSWPFVIFAAVDLLCLLYTQTRGAYVGLVAGIFVTLLCIAFFGRKQYKKFSKISAAGLIAILLLVGLFVKFSDSSFVQSSLILRRLSTINIPTVRSAVDSIRSGNFKEMVDVFGETTIVSRILNMKMSIEGVSESPKTLLLGYGQENYSHVFAHNFDPRMYAQEVWFDRAHNVFMDWLVAGGVLGLIAYLALYLTPLYMMWRGDGRNSMHLIERAILTGALTAYFVHNIFVFDNLISYILFVALLAYIATRTRVDIHVKETAKNLAHLSVTNKRLIVGASIVLTLSMFIVVVIRPLMSNLDIISGFKLFPNTYAGLIASTTDSYTKFATAYNRDTFGNTEVMEQMLQKSMTLAGVDLSKMSPEDASKAKESIAQFKNFAEINFEKMANENPTARNTYFLATYMRQTGNVEKALKYAKMAHDITPTKQVISAEYAANLVASGMISEAVEIAKQAYEYDTTNEQAKGLYETLDSMLKSTSTNAITPKAATK